MDAAKGGLPLRNGIPHHGMLLLVGSQFLVLFATWAAAEVLAINLGLQGGALAFGLTIVASNFLLTGAIWMICRIERGFSNKIDVFTTTIEEVDDANRKPLATM